MNNLSLIESCLILLKIRTDKNHANLTNEEESWRQELEKRRLVSFSTPFGQKIEKKNQIRLVEYTFNRVFLRKEVDSLIADLPKVSLTSKKKVELSYTIDCFTKYFHT